MIDSTVARRFAEEWIAAWNAHDVEAILSHYDDEAELASPVAQKFLGGDGKVRGKQALREYFQRGLVAYPQLRFELFDVLWGTETVVLYHSNNVRGGKTAEVMLLNPAGKVCRIWANYDS